MGAPLRMGLVGAGKISGAYPDTLPRLPGLRLTAVTDLNRARAEAAAKTAEAAAKAAEAAAKTDEAAETAAKGAEGVAKSTGGVAVAASADELMAHEDVDAVLNLTIPAAHAEVAPVALAARRHVYGEKPLSGTREEADAILGVLGAAGRAGLRVGRAPDTVLGPGTQTARRAVDDGLIGTPVAATAFMTTAGPELARHVLDVMLTPRDAARERTSLPVGTTCSRPEPVPLAGEPSASAGHG